MVVITDDDDVDGRVRNFLLLSLMMTHPITHPAKNMIKCKIKKGKL